MLISNTRKEKINIKKLLLYSLAFAICSFIVIFLIYPAYLQYGHIKNSSIIHCDMEVVYKDEFISNGKKFSGGVTQDDKYAHTGTYSSKLSKADDPQYGISYRINDLKGGEIYEASVWVYKQNNVRAFLVFSNEDTKLFYQATEKTGKVEDGFEKISLIAQVPTHMDKKSMDVYVYSDGKSNAYFDDFKIQKLESLPDSIPAPFNPPHLHLNIKETNYLKLKSKRAAAYNSAVLITDEDSWVNAKLVDDSISIPVKIRLKGDWLDHLQNDKWSFRIKAKGSNTWNRMTTFSLHTPAARYYALEWLVHEFWNREDVLTTRYDFVNLSVNGKFLGTYAYEEHFEKQLLEFRKRREGPIVRFSEDALWDLRSRKYMSGIDGRALQIERGAQAKSKINPFQESKIAGSEVLSQQYQIAQNLLFQYQEGLKPAEEIFDMNQMAKYHAIIDIFGAHHSLVWHNQRFYYNPVTSLLEPIGYDAYATQPWAMPLILGKEQLESYDEYGNAPLRSLMNNEVFIEKYMQYLNIYSKEDYLRTFFNETEEAMNTRVDFLSSEFPEFKFDRNRILKRANEIQFKLYPFEAHAVQANWFSNTTNTDSLLIFNTHDLPLKVLGTGNKKDHISTTFKTPLHLPAFRIGNKKIVKKVIAPKTAKYIFFKPYGIDTLYSSPIDLFNRPDDQAPRQALFSNLKITTNELFQVIGKDILFKKGTYQTDQDVIIPSGYRVTFEAGVNLDFIKKAKFISKSPVYLNGRADDLIQIYSSDQSANGFTILQSPDLSSVSFTIIKDFNTLSYKGWNLTGALTFYESDVKIINTKIVDNKCEDALNIIRSKFDIQQLELINPAFDGFDADFCEGKIDNSTIFKPGNDGIDFSGSEITINRCKIFEAGDKGISVGEESRILINNSSVDNAVIGVASKDLSYVRLKNIVLKNCNQGFAAYQKKAEYGRSYIYVESYDTDNVKYLHTIAPRCTLQIDGYFVIGEQLK